ncbi:hypothetical protein DSL72_008370 [Monilinia vaccinii-corymbosi]|uniref:Uncharacterized protein n=1 Tax=Monilinia vaccinii-corymbosi TaxID=61207 RepID=A0A8A3PK71_9HELO|nr:hypothetical protein DSL72_008370 [Monilinia vaccinii-corymbosi]
MHISKAPWKLHFEQSSPCSAITGSEGAHRSYMQATPIPMPDTRIPNANFFSPTLPSPTLPSVSFFYCPSSTPRVHRSIQSSALNLPQGRSSRRKFPHASNHLSLAIRPKIHHQGNGVIDGRIGALVQQSGGQRRQREDHQTRLDAAVKCRVDDEAQGPLPRQHAEPEEQIDDLEDGEGFDGAVEIFRQEIPEDLGPKESGDGGGDLVLISCVSFEGMGRMEMDYVIRTDGGGEDY